MRRLKAQLVVTLLLLSSFLALMGGTPPVGALDVTTFEGGADAIDVVFEAGGGTNDSVKVLVPANSRVSSATLNISGRPYTPGGKDFPDEVRVDYGANGNNDWVWAGTGIGMLGHQGTFSDDTKRVTMDVEGGTANLTASIKVPTNATVTNASFEVQGGTVEGFLEQEYRGNSFDWMGWDVSSAGDLNGDGLPDFIAAAPHRWGSFSNAHVYVFFGNETPKTEPDLDIIYHLSTDDWWSYRIDGAGDVNNDGFDDIIVGAWWADSDTLWACGMAYIYLGGNPMDTTWDIRFEGQDDYDYFGSDVAGVGDVNNDGYDDVIIGAPYNDTFGSSTGSVYLYFGGDPMDNVSDMNFIGGASYYYFGEMVSDAGDFDNDGYPDFMVGAYDDDTNGNHDGAVYIYRGGPSLDNVSDVNIRPLGSYDFGEYGASAGDLNGDGYDDVAICNAYNEVWIYYGSQFLDSDRDLRINGENAMDRFGIGLDGAGDIDNDGYDDLVVGAWGYDLDKAYGKAYLYKGGQNMDTTPDFTRVGDKVTWEMGISVAGVGDFNNDGFGDVVFGSDGTNSSGTRTGSVYLEMYYKGIREPAIGIFESNAELWSHDSYFSGSNYTTDISSFLNAAIDAVGSTETDLYGNDFTELTLNVTSLMDGDLVLKNLTIEYDLTVTAHDFAAELNYFMDQNDPAGDGYYHIPIRVMSTSEGVVRIDGLKVVISEAPVGTAPQGLSIGEGTLNESLVDLYDVFDDDFDADSALKFNLKSHSNGSFVDVSIVDGHFLRVDAMTNTTNINWTGTTRVIIGAVDTDGLKSADVAIDVVVSNVPDEPVVTSKAPTEAMEGQLYEYKVMAVDGDVGDVLSYEITAGPGNLTINSSTGQIRWVPNIDEIGMKDISVRVSDGLSDVFHNFSVDVSIRITSGNTLPIISSAPPTQATVGVQYTYTIEAFDDDWDVLSFSLLEGPSGMTMNKTTGKIVWLPAMADVGLHKVGINVSDGKDRVFQRYIVIVSDVDANHLPVIVGTPPIEAFVDIEYYYKFNATDEDGDALTFSLQNGPFGMGLSGQGVLTWTPVPRDIGSHTFMVRLSDGKGFTTRSFTVDVSVNHAPVITSNPVLDAKVGEEYRYKVVYSDQDTGDVVTIEIVRWPFGMVYDNATSELIWTPDKNQVGDNEVSIKVLDGKHSTSQDFTITVKDDKKTNDGQEDQLGLPWLLIFIIIIIVAILAVWAMTRKKAPEGVSVLEDVFLIYRDGRLISHHTRRLKPETDEYSLTAMLTAIQEFVKESIPTEGEKQKAIDQISFGDDKILLAHGRLLYIAAVITGPVSEDFRARMQDAVNDIEAEFSAKFEAWDGDMRDLAGAKLRMKQLLTEGAEEGEEEMKDVDELEDKEEKEATEGPEEKKEPVPPKDDLDKEGAEKEEEKDDG